MIGLIGGSGFIGSYICEQLEALGHEFVIGDIAAPRAEYHGRYVEIDVLDITAVASFVRNCKVLIILAATHADDEIDITRYYSTNVVGLLNILDSLEKSICGHVVFYSSVAAINSLELLSPYGQSKLICEKLLSSWCKRQSRVVIDIIRPTAVFGCGSHGNFSNLVRHIRRPWFVRPSVVSSRKSLAYVENLVAYTLLLIEQPSKSVEPRLSCYVDGPDFEMGELIDYVSFFFKGRKAGKINHNVFWFVFGLVKTSERMMPLWIRHFAARVEKLLQTTQFEADLKVDFEPNYDLRMALDKTLQKIKGLNRE